MRIFIINDLNDILKKRISHFSLDKGLFLGHGLAKNNCQVYFLTTGKTEFLNNINFINILEAHTEFLNTIDLIIIVREALIPELLENYTVFKQFLINHDKKTKIMVKSDSIQWILDKNFRKYVSKEFNTKAITSCVVKWACNIFDYICVQTIEFKNDALQRNIPENKLVVLNMAISDEIINYENLTNPYTTNHDYCVKNYKNLDNNKALIPLYYLNNPEKITEFNKNKKIIVYMGRIKTDSGKILFTMKDIMNKLGNDYELHIFPGSFVSTIPVPADREGRPF